MREHFDRLLAQTSLVTLALAIAIGWSLFQVAKGVADLVNVLLTEYPNGSQLISYVNSQPATWIVQGRVLTFTDAHTRHRGTDDRAHRRSADRPAKTEQSLTSRPLAAPVITNDARPTAPTGR